MALGCGFTPRTASRGPATRRNACISTRRRNSCRAAKLLRPLLIDNYDSYTYNLYQIVAEVYGVAPLVLHNDAADISHIQDLLQKGEVHHIILSPGPGTPDLQADIGVCMDILHTCIDTPVLGVCLGHQALAAAAGASVIRAPEPVHGRLSCIRHNGHELFAGCPSGPLSDFEVVRYHSLIVDSSSVPDQLEVLAWTAGQHRPVHLQQMPVQIRLPTNGHQLVNQQHQQQHDTHQHAELLAHTATQPQQQPQQLRHQQQLQQHDEGLIMAIRHRQRPHYGVQFHPESIATRYGIQLLMNFRDIAYKQSKVDVPGVLQDGLLLQPKGPPGRPMTPRPWPQQQQQQQHNLPTAGIAADAKQSPTAASNSNLSVLAPAGYYHSSSCASSSSDGSSSIEGSNRGLELQWLKLPGVLSDVGSDQLFDQLVGSGPDTFWLDSACAPERSRFSFMGGGNISGPCSCRITYQLPSEAQQHPSRTATAGAAADCHSAQHHCATPGILTISTSGHGKQQSSILLQEQQRQQQQKCSVSIWEYLEDQLQRLQLLPSSAAAAAAELPFNFWGGFVGYFGYELKAECGGDNAHTAPEPDAAWLFVDRLLVCDHHTQDVYLLALHAPAAVGQDNGHCAEAQQWLKDTAAAVYRVAQQQHQIFAGRLRADQQLQQQRQSAQLQQCSLRHAQDVYVDLVQSCQSALVAGESYELCLTTAYQIQQPPEPYQLYKTLRRSNPAPYAAWLNIGASANNSNSSSRVNHQFGSSSKSSSSESSIIVCCSSPERFLQGGRGGVLEAKPIKGTAARCPEDPVADAAAAAALISSEKERAENLMIVDLLRNDLGKVCEPGSVHVPGLIELESYASVHQLVSTVRGLRRSDASCIEAIRAAFPGGSMTGAPKVRSMQILDKLEGAARGVYSGALGYLSVNDTFDLNIVIRTAVFTPQQQNNDTVTTGRKSMKHTTEAGEYSSSRNAVDGAASSSENGYTMHVGAGGAVVVQSDPAAEFAEMQLKASRLLETAAEVQQMQSSEHERALVTA